MRPPTISPAPPLSPAQMRVLRALGWTGGSDKQIARDLGISPCTVKYHVKRMTAATGLENRTQLALWAAAWGLVPNGFAASQHPRSWPRVLGDGALAALTGGSLSGLFTGAAGAFDNNPPADLGKTDVD